MGKFEEAVIHARLGEIDRAFEYLEKAYEIRDHWMQYLKMLRMFDPLRRHPRCEVLLAKMKLSPALSRSEARGYDPNSPSEKRNGCHCERPQGPRQSNFHSTHYEIASVVSLPRNDVLTPTRTGEARAQGLGQSLKFLLQFVRRFTDISRRRVPAHPSFFPRASCRTNSRRACRARGKARLCPSTRAAARP